MAKFVVYRTLYAVLLLFVASVAIFVGMRATSGDVADVIANPLNSAASAKQIRQQLGLDKPLPVQYVTYTKDLLTGHPGSSLVSGQPILDLLRKAGGYTLKLALASALLTYLTAIPLGVLAAWKRNSVLDQGAMFLAVLGMGLPNFFLAILLIQLFAIKLRWLPIAGAQSPQTIILPAVCLAAEAIAINLRVVRSSVLEELNRDYVRTLEAKGLPQRRILWLHVLRNASPPVIALAGVMLRTLLGYTLIVETIFRWPGLGYQLVTAILRRDYPVAETLALLLTAAVILFNLLADIGQQWADPRIRHQSRAA